MRARGATFVVGVAAVTGSALLGVLAARHAARSMPSRSPGAPARVDAAGAAQHLPLTFERNDGQFSPAIRFAGVQSGGRIAIHDAGFTIAPSPDAPPITVAFSGSLGGRAEGRRVQDATVNYFVGRDPSRWKRRIPTFAEIRRDGIYRGIDVVYYGRGRQLEYDLRVHPGADPRMVRLRVAGAAASVDAHSGDLVLTQGAREIRHHRPVAYQSIGNARHEVAARYVKRGREIGIDVETYDAGRELVIDPVVAYTTYIAADDVAVDRAGNVYLSASTTLPGPVPFGFEFDFAQHTPGYQPSVNGVFVARLAPDGTRLLFSTFLAADTTSVLKSRIAVDGLGALYVSTYDASGIAPTTVAGLSTTSTFVASVSAADGQLRWGTYVGRFLETQLIAALPAGGVAIAGKMPAPGGVVRSLPIPTTFRSAAGGAEAWVVTLSGGMVQGATYFGGSADDEPTGLAAGPDGSVYLAGTTHSRDLPLSNALQVGLGQWAASSAFLARLNPALTGLTHSTYFGGNFGATAAAGLAVDATGAAYLAGYTEAVQFPISTGRTFSACFEVPIPCETVFLAKFHPSGGLTYSNVLDVSAGFQVYPVAPSQPFSEQLNKAATPVAVTANGEPILSFNIMSSVLPLVRSVQPTRGDGPLLHSYDRGRTFEAKGLGPNCLGGGALLFAPSDPKTVLAVNGGLCRSTDGGRTWQFVTNYPLGPLAISPADPRVLLSATSDGLRRSTDAGATWTIVSGIPFRRATQVAFDPSNAMVAYASLAQGGVYRTADAGATWTEVPSPSGTPFEFERVASTTPTTLFATTPDARWKSTDGGTTWQPLPPSRVRVLASDPTNGAIVYGAHELGAGVCRSTDAGATWPQCSAAGLTGFLGAAAHSLAVDAATPSVIYGAFAGGISFSEDSGLTWQRSPLRTGYRGAGIAADPALSGHVLLLWPNRDDAAVLKFDASGAAILFSTYFGGSGEDRPLRIETDAAGSIYLYGLTHSPDLPTNSIIAESGGGRTLFTPLRHFIRNQSDDPLDYFLTRIAPRPGPPSDFDADGRTDPSIFRPATGEWWTVPSRERAGEYLLLGQPPRRAETAALGQSGDLPAAADFDGDGQADVAVFRPSNGQWLIRDSSTMQSRAVLWGGTTADIPAPADYDGDGKADIAVFRPSNGYWYILQSATNTPRYVQWGGTAHDVPAPGDYDGDGRADIAFFRPSNGYWYLRRSTAGIHYVQWGGTLADVAVPGDYDGDGRTDTAVFRPSDLYWYIRFASGGVRYVKWGGLASDVPVPGDYDQDGITDQAFFRAADGYWYILQSRTRTARYVNLGTVGDVPIPGRR
ncbi:MAG TPA: FG-GAP-like repeat-containing protein [Vicinamibacterales bacterium]|nr:FG-GAP-like repeat-containing protein [Vicinamibacterales bacterium]